MFINPQLEEVIKDLKCINPLGYNDGRIDDCMKHLTGVKTAVDLGSMEGDNSFVLRGYNIDVTGIESNLSHYSKAIVKKSFLESGVKFFYGDVLEYFKSYRDFDLCVCFGILYHMVNPIELLEKVSHIKNLIIWTHYFNEDEPEANKIVSGRNYEAVPFKNDTFFYYKQVYDKKSETYCGGTELTSSWMNKKDIFKILNILGYDVTLVNDINTVNGSAMLLVCTKN